MINSADEGAPQEPRDDQGEAGELIPEESPPQDERSPLEILQGEYDDLHDRYLRLAADFENFRKRSTRDMEFRTNSAIERFAKDMLEVADSLDRALIAEGGDHEGMTQIKKLFENVLERQGIQPYESSGEPFDPARHDAIAYVPSDKDEGTVCDEVCKGYCLNSKVIRPAKVTVSRGNEPQQSQE
ncbi:MAG: nucleotide exchange factor GrpE [Methanospirillum sp.]|uniref:nucleotide exchange factor GrpE n=1 Tax=Methanospirillum sp. TaxID=45200 RepID=UPI002369A8ED|nr:nucleotide exchange factor GrpE [Methanospirillum sp.]MDD1729099.1 nucleotide exchange factor GrpE [Methanospirillum sp.]